MAEAESITKARIDQWVAENYHVDKITEQLNNEGRDETSIAAHLEEFRKKKQLKKQGFGFIYIAAGSVLGFIGCVIAMVNPFPELYHWFLYGFGSASVLIIFIGLYQVFE